MSGGKAPDEVDRAVGRALREARQGAGLSQEKVAEACGVTFQQLGKYEKGVNRISVGRFVAAARVLELSPEHLLRASFAQLAAGGGDAS